MQLIQSTANQEASAAFASSSYILTGVISRNKGRSLPAVL